MSDIVASLRRASRDDKRRVFVELWGAPTEEHQAHLRFGTHGSLAVNIDGLQWHSFEDNSGGGLLDAIIFAGQAKTRADAAEWLRAFAGEPAASDQPEPRPAGDAIEAKHDLARKLYNRAGPLAGTPSERYLLRQRGLTGPFPETLRHGRRLKSSEDGRVYCGLVAPRVMLERPEDIGSIVEVYLTPQGEKAALRAPKRTLGACKGGAVPLGEIGDELLVAEGVETTLAAMELYGAQAGAATLGAGFLKLLIVPERVRRVMICADNDASGEGLRAARSLATRLRDEGRTVTIRVPRTGKDFNDQLKATRRSPEDRAA